MLIEDLFEAALGKLSCLDMSEEIESVFFTAPMEAFLVREFVLFFRVGCAETSFSPRL